MDYYLVLSEINRYFLGISTLDVNWIASAFSYNDYGYEQILGELTKFINPEYYKPIFEMRTRLVGMR